jgi:hypothetical protein
MATHYTRAIESPKTNPIPTGTELTLIVPWAPIQTTKEFVENTINGVEWGEIIQVDLIKRAGRDNYRTGRRDPDHYKIFIHLKNLTENGKLANQHLSVSEGKEIRVTHRFGYWKVQKSNFVFKEEFKTERKKPLVEFL